MHPGDGSRLTANVLAILLVAGLAGHAQEEAPSPKVTNWDFNVRHLRSPSYRERTLLGGVKSLEWTQLLLEYELTVPLDGWVDRLALDWVVQIKTRSGKVFVLRGSVDYLDVRAGERRAVMYIRPRFIERYNDGSRLGERDCKVFVMITCDGNEAGTAGFPTESRQTKWWEADNPDAIVREGVLLNRMQTPFAPLDFDALEYIPSTP